MILKTSRVLSITAVIALFSVGAHAATYVATLLYNSGNSNFYSLAFGVSGDVQVGYGSLPMTSGIEQALLWTGTPESIVNLKPSCFTQSYAYDASGASQVGYGIIVGRHHALLWSGTAASAVDLHPTGFTDSTATGVSGAKQSGYGFTTPVAGISVAHALLWNGTATSVVDLNPPGSNSSVANDVWGNVQVGYGSASLGSNDSHAMLWNGTAGSAVDLNPPGFVQSVALGAYGAYQVGYASTHPGFNILPKAFLWNGTAESGVNLSPNSTLSTASGISAAGEVGWASDPSMNGEAHAMYWNGTAASAIDLDQFLPADFKGSYATGISDEGAIVGYALNPNSHYVAVLWTPVPEPSSLSMISGGAIFLFALVGKRKKGGEIKGTGTILFGTAVAGCLGEQEVIGVRDSR